jgi:hypothetical protein
VSGATLTGGTDTADALLLKKMWSCDHNGDLQVVPTESNPGGMRSRIKGPRFDRLKNELTSDIPRDMLDTTLTSVSERLINGRKLQGKNLKVTIRNKALVPVTLENVTITYIKS